MDRPGYTKFRTLPAMLASLIATSNMSRVNPVDYFADTLRIIFNGHLRSPIQNLMP